MADAVNEATMASELLKCETMQAVNESVKSPGHLVINTSWIFTMCS